MVCRNATHTHTGTHISTFQHLHCKINKNLNPRCEHYVEIPHICNIIGDPNDIIIPTQRKNASPLVRTTLEGQQRKLAKPKKSKEPITVEVLKAMVEAAGLLPR